MTAPLAWRVWRALAAGSLIVAIGAAGCSNGRDDAGTGVTVPAAPGDIPADHGLSDARVDAVLPSTVGISGVACGRLASGSGFAITNDRIVTNAHVILGVDDIRVHTFDGRDLGATPIAFDADADLAMLEVRGAELEPLGLAEMPADGTIGMLAGWEPEPGPQRRSFRIDRAITVRIERVGDIRQVERPAWLLAAAVEPGDSGAALIDSGGEVVGVAFAASKEGSGVGYAVPVSEIEALMAEGLDPNLTIPGC